MTRIIDAEHNIGIETFFTKTKGIEGKLRTIPEDFIVRERFLYPKQNDNGSFTIAEVTARNWETNLLLRELANTLHISRMRIGFAGTKDKRACSTQLMSFANVPPDILAKINIPDVHIEHIYQSDRQVSIGDLIGNCFDITIRNIDKKTTSDQIEKTASQINSIQGFPNFFGVQRFGIIRPVNHLIGKALLSGNFEQAVMTYIANPIKGEDEKTYILREQLQKTYNFAEALTSYPPALSFEKAILNRLVVNPHEFISAFTALPKNLLTMFIYAYQSYLFNQILSERIRQKLPFNQAIEGDVVLPIRNNTVAEDEHILVNTTNLEKVNMQIKKGKAMISALLVGSDSTFSQGTMGEIEHHIIDKEHIKSQDFIIPELPFLSSSGTRRAILAAVNNLTYTIQNDEFHPEKQTVKLHFELRKGCYATALLREFMKSTDITSY